MNNTNNPLAEVDLILAATWHELPETFCGN